MGVVIGLLFSALQLIVGMAFALGGVMFSIRLFDSFTKNIEEWEEIKKGNYAVGLLLAAIILSIAIIIKSGVIQISSSIAPGLSLNEIILGLALGAVNLIISLIVATFVIFLAVRILDYLTPDVDDMKELRKGNVAYALVIVGAILAVSFMITGTVEALMDNVIEPLIMPQM